MRTCLIILALTSAVPALSGCGASAEPPTPSAYTPVALDRSKYVLSEEPEGAIGVIAARESAHDGDSVVIVGRIGGAANPWIEGRAAFTMLDASKSIVAQGTEPSSGQLCTGDCCALERAACTILIKIVDEAGRVLVVDSREAFGLTSEDMVVVRGKISKDESGNVALLADGLHIRR